MELCGSPITEELREEHSPRVEGGVEIGSWGREDMQQGDSWRSKWSHICMQINKEEQLGNETDHTIQGSSMGEIKPQNL